MTHPADVNPVPKDQEELLEFEFGGGKSYSGLSFWLTDVWPGVCGDPDVWQVLPETCVVAATDTSSWNQLIHIAAPCCLVCTFQVYVIAPALPCTDAWPFLFWPVLLSCQSTWQCQGLLWQSCALRPAGWSEVLSVPCQVIHFHWARR